MEARLRLLSKMSTEVDKIIASLHRTQRGICAQLQEMEDYIALLNDLRVLSNPIRPPSPSIGPNSQPERGEEVSTEIQPARDEDRGGRRRMCRIGAMWSKLSVRYTSSHTCACSLISPTEPPLCGYVLAGTSDLVRPHATDRPLYIIFDARLHYSMLALIAFVAIMHRLSPAFLFLISLFHSPSLSSLRSRRPLLCPLQQCRRSRRRAITRNEPDLSYHSISCFSCTRSSHLGMQHHRRPNTPAAGLPPSGTTVYILLAKTLPSSPYPSTAIQPADPSAAIRAPHLEI